MENSQALFQLKSDYCYTYHDARIDIRKIYTLPQPRKTFEDIETLADDIARRGLLHPLVVARYSRDELIAHLTTINSLWKTRYRVDKFPPLRIKDKDLWYILLSGERRLRALRLLYSQGCTFCHEEFGDEPEGKCFKRHLNSVKIRVSLCEDIPSVEALFLQLAENIHQNIPPHEEAEAYYNTFNLIRSRQPTYTIRSFARNVGRSPETISHALQYCELPDKIRVAVGKRIICYSIALEITRLAQIGADENELCDAMIDAVIGNCNTTYFREVISSRINAKKDGQLSLLDLFEESQINDVKKASRKHTVEMHSVRGLHGYVAYFRRVEELYRSGLLGNSDSPFSERSPLKIYCQMVEIQRRILRHLKNLYPNRQITLTRIERILERNRIFIEELDEEMTEDSSRG